MWRFRVCAFCVCVSSWMFVDLIIRGDVEALDQRRAWMTELLEELSLRLFLPFLRSLHDRVYQLPVESLERRDKYPALSVFFPREVKRFCQ